MEHTLRTASFYHSVLGSGEGEGALVLGLGVGGSGVIGFWKKLKTWAIKRRQVLQRASESASLRRWQKE